MTKRIGKSNVIPMSKRKAAVGSEASNLSAAKELVYRAMESKGKQCANYVAVSGHAKLGENVSKRVEEIFALANVPG